MIISVGAHKNFLRSINLSQKLNQRILRTPSVSELAPRLPVFFGGLLLTYSRAWGKAVGVGFAPRARKIRLRFTVSKKIWEISQKSTNLVMSRTIVVLASKNRFLQNSPSVF